MDKNVALLAAGIVFGLVSLMSLFLIIINWKGSPPEKNIYVFRVNLTFLIISAILCAWMFLARAS